MANFTPNVNLEKPLGSEHYLIPKFNANMDKIDTKFGELQNLGGIISEAIAKATPVDADTVALSDSAETGALKKLSWLNIKATLKAYFDTLYATIANLNLKAPLANPTFTGTQTLPNIVTNGIKFPATQVPSADPNTLDDYEEGTFTPTVFGSETAGIISTGNGCYTKIGNLVHFEIETSWSNHTGTGNLRIGNLPFIQNSPRALYFVVGELLSYSGTQLLGLSASPNTIQIMQTSGGGGIVEVLTDPSVSYFLINGTYTTSS